MQVKLITGKAGSGKTYASIAGFIDCVTEHGGAFSKEHCYFIVPEQFCVETEAKILGSEGISGLIGGEVISFNRLCLRILGELGIEGGEPVSSSGRAMLLADILIKNNERLTFFKDMSQRPAACGKLLETLTECRKYNISPEILKKLAESEQNDLTQTKLDEIALLLDAYNKLFEKDHFDVQLFYSRIAELIEADRTSISDSYIFIDSFSGFTENEMLLIKAFAKRAKSLSIALSKNVDNGLVYGCPNATFNYVRSVFAKENIRYAEQSAENAAYGRFKANEAIGYIADRFGLPNAGKAPFDASGSVKIIAADCFFDEVKCLADNITALVNGGMRFSDVAAVLPENIGDAYLVESVLAERGIPYFVDTKKEISGHPAIRLIYGFLNVLADDMKLGDVVGMLKTGLFMPSVYTPEAVDNIENKLIELGAKDRRAFLKMLSYMEKRGTGSFLYRRLYDFFYGEKGFSERAKNCASVRDVLGLVLDFAGEIGLEESLERLTAPGGEPFVKVWNAFARIITECSEIMGDARVRGYKKLIKYTCEILMNGVSMFRLGSIPTSKNCVQIGNIARSRYSDKKVVFVLGANDGSFPAPAADNGFIDDTLRRGLRSLGASLGYDSESRVLLNMFNVFSVLAAPSEKLFISYSRQDSRGEELLPSPVIAKLCGDNGLFDLTPVTYSAAESGDTEKSPVLSGDIGEELSSKLLFVDNVFKSSVSRISEYFDCPKKFFADNVLRLKEREEPTIASNDAGSLFHAMIEGGVKSAENGNFASMGEAEWDEVIEETCKAYFEDDENADKAYARDLSNTNRLTVDRIIEFAKYDGAKISEYSRSSGFIPKEEELEFGRKNSDLPEILLDCGGITAAINGKIDRVDARPTNDGNELCIVDYKSSLKTISDTTVENGSLMQLLIYKTALEAGLSGNLADKLGRAAFVGAVAFYVYGKKLGKDSSRKHAYVEAADERYSDGLISEKAYVKNLGELERENNERIKELVRGIGSGDFSPSVRDKSDPCRYCSLSSVCKAKNIGKETYTDEN